MRDTIPTWRKCITTRLEATLSRPSKNLTVSAGDIYAVSTKLTHVCPPSLFRAQATEGVCLTDCCAADEPNTHGQAQAQAQRRARAPPAQQHSVPYRQAPGFPGMDMGFPGMDMGFPGMGMGFPGMASPGMRMMSMGFPGMPFPSMNALMAPQAGSGSSSYSYSSFSSSSGPGIQYQRSSTSRRGPGGVRSLLSLRALCEA